MKKITQISILSFVFAAACLLGCNEPEMKPVEETYPAYSIVDGDTVRTEIPPDYKQITAQDPTRRITTILGDTVILYQKPFLHKAPSQIPDLSVLKDPSNLADPLRLVAIGGSLTAGVRDGGYFNEGIETSYANMVARQMGAVFNQPYFPASDYNGIGRKALTGYNPTGGPAPKFKVVKNNLALKVSENSGFEFPQLNDLLKNDNIGIPYVSSKYSLPGDYIGVTLTGPISFNNLIAKRVIYTKSFGYQWFNEKKFDFFIFEVGMNDVLELLNTQYTYVSPYPKVGLVSSKESINKNYEIQKGVDNLTIYSVWYLSGIHSFLLESELRNLNRGCILNLPNVLEMPYYTLLPVSKAKAEFSKVNRTMDLPYGGIVNDPNTEYMMPNSTIDSLLSPKVNVALKPGINPKYHALESEDFVAATYAKGLMTRHNEEKELLAKRFNLPLVDLYSLYEKINRGEYVTNDGVRVDPGYPKGNFYSSDGIFPTPFGNAVIANEVIRTINAFYKTEIPLISTKEYLSK